MTRPWMWSITCKMKLDSNWSVRPGLQQYESAWRNLDLGPQIHAMFFEPFYLCLDNEISKSFSSILWINMEDLVG